MCARAKKRQRYLRCARAAPRDVVARSRVLLDGGQRAAAGRVGGRASSFHDLLYISVRVNNNSRSVGLSAGTQRRLQHSKFSLHAAE